MSDKKLVAVTIPIFKSRLDQFEIISLTQCLKVLGNRPIIFYGPEYLDITFYINFCSDKANVSFMSFSKVYFNDSKGYDHLMLSKEFYKAFLNYEYILNYRLSAYVFKDDLTYWCKIGYYFVSAPNIESDKDVFLKRFQSMFKFLYKYGIRIYSFRNVSNSNLSLRHVGQCLKLVTLFSSSARKWKKHPEDKFFMYWGNLLFPFFRLPDEKTAARFSLDLHPKQTFELVGNNLPFGCHSYSTSEEEMVNL